MYYIIPPSKTLINQKTNTNFYTRRKLLIKRLPSMTWCSWGNTNREIPKAYTETCQTSKMKPFAKIINGFHRLTIFASSPILDVWQTSLKYCYKPDSFVILEFLGGAGGGAFLLLSVKLWLGVSTDGELRTGVGLDVGGARSRVSLVVLDSLELLMVRCRDEDIISLLISWLLLPSCFLKKSAKTKQSIYGTKYSRLDQVKFV